MIPPRSKYFARGSAVARTRTQARFASVKQLRGARARLHPFVHLRAPCAPSCPFVPLRAPWASSGIFEPRWAPWASSGTFALVRKSCGLEKEEAGGLPGRLTCVLSRLPSTAWRLDVSHDLV